MWRVVLCGGVLVFGLAGRRLEPPSVCEGRRASRDLVAVRCGAHKEYASGALLLYSASHRGVVDLWQTLRSRSVQSWPEVHNTSLVCRID